MNYVGWKQQHEFYALDGPKPGSIRVAVGEAKPPHRMMLNHNYKTQEYWNNEKNSMTFAGWTHFYEFWAYPEDLKISGIEYDLDKALVVESK